MKKILTGSYLLLLMFVITACGGDSTPAADTAAASVSTPAAAIEKPQLTFGFIKLTDMAPLAIAK